MKKVFLDNLPRWEEGHYAKEGSINWKKSVGYTVKFIYDDIEGEVKIIDYDNANKKQLLILEYKNINDFYISTPHFLKCKLGNLINNIVVNKKLFWMIKYFQGGYDEAKKYTYSSNKKIYPICPDCGRVKNKLISINNLYTKHSIGCICSDGQSYPFKFMFSILEQLKIDFKTEYSPNWIKPKRYDFYFELNNEKYIIEMDGGLGHGKTNNLMNGITREESKFIDDKKDELAYEHNIEVIRIDCEKSDMEYIKNTILNSKLNELFVLSKTNWELAEECAFSNLAKKVCDIKRGNPDLTTTQIGNMMELNCDTIRSYLKKGTKLGWCNYDPKKESKKTSSKNGINNGKQVEIFKDGKSLGIFESCCQLERQSEKIFGVKLFGSLISKVCKGERIFHKGFTFKYK